MAAGAGKRMKQILRRIQAGELKRLSEHRAVDSRQRNAAPGIELIDDLPPWGVFTGEIGTNQNNVLISDGRCRARITEDAGLQRQAVSTPVGCAFK